MKRIILLIMALAFVGSFGYTAIAEALNVKKSQQVQRIDIQSKQLQINKYELTLKKLNSNLNVQLKKKKLDSKKIKQLEQDIENAQRTERGLRRELERKQALRRQKRERASQLARSAFRAQSAGAYTSGCGELGSKLSRLGVNGAELTAAITLATRESGCRSSAVNPSSGACGEFQSYPCGKWGTPGTDQYLRNAIGYAKGRYGSYQAALAHSYARNWY